MSRSLPRVRASWLGSVPYRKAWDLQAALVRERREGGGEDALLLLEHPHVFTMGKAATSDHLLWDEEERARRPSASCSVRVVKVRTAPSALVCVLVELRGLPLAS